MKLLYFFLLLLPFQFALNVAEGADVATGRIAALLVIFFVIASALRKKSFKISFSPISLLLFLFLFWSGFSLFWAGNAAAGFRKFIFLINFIPLFWVIKNLPEDCPLASSEKVLLWPGLIASLIGIFQFGAQFFWGTEAVFNFWKTISPFLYGKTFSQSILLFNSWLVEIGGRTFFRAIAFFPDPHIFGFYLAFITPLALLSKRKLFKTFGAVFILALLLTFSRQAYVGALGALAVWGVLLISNLTYERSECAAKAESQISNPQFKSQNLVFPIIIFVFLILFFPLTISRLFSSFDFSENSVASRFENWSQGITLIKEHSLGGVGLGNYAFSVDPEAGARTPIYAHNLYIDIGAELGIIGLIFFLGILASAIIKSFRAKQYPLFLTFIWFSAQAMFDTPLFSVHILPLLIIFLALSDNYEVS